MSKLILHAKPYDTFADGFYFETEEEFDEKSKNVKNDLGNSVEEFIIRFIDGDGLDGELADAIKLDQTNFRLFLYRVDEWTDLEKIDVIIAVGDCGYPFNEHTYPQDFDISLYEENSMEDLARHFVDEGLYGDIPTGLQNYIDYEAIARDLSMEYDEITIAGQSYIYHCR